MAEYVVNPIEIDPQLTDLTEMSTYVIKDGKSLSTLLPDPIPQAAVDNGMLAGFSSARSTAGREDDQSLINAVLRFPDAAAAQKAATALHEATMTNDYGTGLPQAGAIDVLPSTLVSTVRRRVRSPPTRSPRTTSTSSTSGRTPPSRRRTGRRRPSRRPSATRGR
ncbi:hypothetical protein GS491_23990 [Rhodococcus hoagii]|nr:hypothetical protein [Prescottella equi]